MDRCGDGAVERLASVDVLDDLRHVSHRGVDIAAIECDLRELRQRQCRHDLAAELPKHGERRFIRSPRIVEAAERHLRIAHDDERVGLEIARIGASRMLDTFHRQLHGGRGIAERPDDGSEVAQRIGASHRISDVAAEALA